MSYLNQENEVISEPKVMKSAAGFYVGRSYHEKDDPHFEMPYDRISEWYFETAEKAEEFLTAYHQANE